MYPKTPRNTVQRYRPRGILFLVIFHFSFFLFVSVLNFGVCVVEISGLLIWDMARDCLGVNVPSSILCFLANRGC